MSSQRIGYLLKKFPRLSETFVLDEILAQEDLGRAVHVFSRRPTDDEPRHPQLARLRAAVEILPRARELNPWSDLFQGDRAEERLGRVRALAADAVLTGHPRFADLLAEALGLVQRTRARGIEHLHVHFATDAAFLALLARELGGPTYSITAHAKDIYRATVDPAVLDRVIGGSAFTVTVCDANVAHLEGLVGSTCGERVRRLYNGIDVETFAFHPEGRRPHRILGVGRLVEKKGFDLLVDALALLARDGVPFEAVIAGDGEEREALAARVRERGLEGSVEFPGALDQDGVRALVRAATIFALPCRVGADGNRDALPTVLLEALASGLPCVSTPISGVPEILDGGAAGVLARPEDPRDLARCLKRLLGDPVERDRLARAGRARAEALFDRRRNSRVLYGWFDEALSPESLECA